MINELRIQTIQNEMNMHYAIQFIAVSMFFTTLGSSCYANEPTKHTLSEQVSESDTVILGRVDSIELGSDSSNRGFEYAVISVSTVLKGHANHKIKVVTKGDAPEEDAGSLEVGTGYLLLLHRSTDGRYHAVNGWHSVHAMPCTSPSHAK